MTAIDSSLLYALADQIRFGLRDVSSLPRIAEFVERRLRTLADELLRDELARSVAEQNEDAR